MFIFKNLSTCFGHHYAHLQENKTYVTACGVLRWFCWMWLVTFTVLAPYNAAPHNRYQPHPAEPAQYTTCSNIRIVLLKMGIVMPETCWEIVENKHVTVASCWFSLLLHNLLTMHGHRNLKNLFLLQQYAHLRDTTWRNLKELWKEGPCWSWSDGKCKLLCVVVRFFNLLPSGLFSETLTILSVFRMAVKRGLLSRR